MYTIQKLLLIVAITVTVVVTAIICNYFQNFRCRLLVRLKSAISDFSRFFRYSFLSKTKIYIL